MNKDYVDYYVIRLNRIDKENNIDLAKKKKEDLRRSIHKGNDSMKITAIETAWKSNNQGKS